MAAHNPSKKDVETGTRFLPRFDDNGLIPAFVSDADTGEALMVAYMNKAALLLSLETGEAHFWSRSRQEIWHKGGTSGNVMKITDIHIDCDQDALWVAARPQGKGAACHTGQRSCFYRKLVLNDDGVVLEDNGSKPMFDPADIYGE